jgi:hypothetical protein
MMDPSASEATLANGLLAQANGQRTLEGSTA